MKLQEKIAIITGAASGIGKATALVYAKEGAKVIVADVNYEEAQNTCHEIEKMGGKALALKVDVTNEADISNLFATSLNKFGTIDILVNNAGIMDNMAGGEDISDEIWYRVVETNTTSVMRMIRKVLPIFITKKSGVIINIASVGGLKGCVAGIAYTASKHAVIGITKNVAFYYTKDGIRCNAIAPGPIRTDIRATMNNVSKKGIEICKSGMNLVPRLGEAEEIANIALFLASEDSSFVNGAVIIADGGWMAY